VSELEQRVGKLLEQGYELVQQGRVVVAFDPEAKPKPTFADRIEHPERASLIRSGDTLLDDEEQWFHLRKPSEGEGRA
jgi:hypothetical protein